MKITLARKYFEPYFEIKEKNILVSNIYNDFLENFAPFINKKEIEKINKGEMSYYDLFLEDLDIDKNDGDFKILEKEYQLDNFNELDPNAYLNNAYYKNIKIDETKKDELKLFYDSYNPYELFLSNEINVDATCFFKETYSMGYFKNKFPFLSIEENDTNWMSITPHEINTMAEPIKNAFGNVLVFGLGLAYFPYMISLSTKVNSITIIENNPKIIELFNSSLKKFFSKANIKIIKDDAFNFIKNTNLKYDYVFVDTYHNAFDGLKTYLSFKKLEDKFNNTNFSYWIEKSILCLLRRYILSLIEEQFDGLKESAYKTSKNDEDEIMNKLYFALKDYPINKKEDLDDLLSDKNLIKLAKII